tara:strand:- start:624 stop:770 length:147 start_codon:yes stop_codon:yes gene_type:complete
VEGVEAIGIIVLVALTVLVVALLLIVAAAVLVKDTQELDLLRLVVLEW